MSKLRQVKVLQSLGKTAAEATQSIGVTEVTYFRWRKEFGGLKLDQIKRLKDFENENARLRRAVSDMTLEKMILAEAAKDNVWSAPSMQGFLEKQRRQFALMYLASCERAAVAARP